MSFVLFALSVVYRRQENKILFVCNGGRKYGDNIAPIYQFLLKDEDLKDWSFVWAFTNPNENALQDKERTILCKIDSIRFYIEALTSKCWITNISVQRGLSFQKKNTIYINTWHGVPLKLLGLDDTKGYSFRNKNPEVFDLMIAASEYDLPIMKRAFHVKNNNVKLTGYPRNDILFTCDKNAIRMNTRKELGASEETKVVLYAPTYRDFNSTKNGDITFDLPITIEKFSKFCAKEYSLWVRMHELTDIAQYGSSKIVDVTKYESNFQLLIAADVLVSDYSGIIFEYALLEKPIIIYAFDLDEYREKRGLYVDIEKDFPFHVSRTEDDLYKYLMNMDYDEECKKTREFKNKYGLVEGNATSRVTKEIKDLLKMR